MPVKTPTAKPANFGHETHQLMKNIAQLQAEINQIKAQAHIAAQKGDFKTAKRLQKSLEAVVAKFK